MKIYTKTGDKGQTSLYGGTKVSKAHIRVEAYGTVDELNAHIARVRDLVTDNAIRASLLRIQNELFVLGGVLATAPGKEKLSMDTEALSVEKLEEEIDHYNETLPAQKHFILPGGHPVVSSCHIARSVCRRAERRVVQLDDAEGVPPKTLKYLNRLSDYLFVLARKLTQLHNGEEIQWKS
jgi:cob(I)alamin adenosyltransferase